MQKIILLIFLIFLYSRCSVIRKDGNEHYSLNLRLERSIILDELRKKNLSENGFIIQKAEIELNTPGERNIFLATIKFERPDKYLISIKSRSGIEAARIFISKDTILINDRINRKLYCGTPDYIKNKYGISNVFLPVILGDFISNNVPNEYNISCLNGMTDYTATIKGLKIKYIIDCKKGKTIQVIPELSEKENIIEIGYSEFLRTGELFTAGKIMIREIKGRQDMQIRIKKIEYPWKGIIEFVPGDKYEIIRLL